MIKKILKVNIIKTLYYNLKIVGISSILNPQIIIGFGCKLKLSKKSKIEFINKKARLFLGVFDGENRHSHNKYTYLSIYGGIHLTGRVNINKGADIFVHEGALLELNALYLGPDCNIICNKNICFSEKCIVSWNCTFIDGDTHPIFDNNNKVINNNEDIIIGKNNWIGFNSIILKGVKTADNIIIAASSFVTKDLEESNYIYASNIKKKYFNYFEIEERVLFH